VDNPIVASARYADAPWIAADLAVLNEAAMNVRLDVDLYLLTTKRTRDQELVWHSGNPTAMPSASEAWPVIGHFPLVKQRCSAAHSDLARCVHAARRRSACSSSRRMAV
jgi:hypothetical protein